MITHLTRRTRRLSSHVLGGPPSATPTHLASSWRPPSQPDRIAAIQPASQQLLRQHGAIAVDDACAAALEMCVPTYRFVRRYLDCNPKPPLALRQVDHLIRELTQYRDHINRMTKESPDEPR